MDRQEVSRIVFEAMGAASTCWENMEGTGVFQSTRAREVGDEAVDAIMKMEEPQLGLATTRQMIEELKTRLSFYSDTGSWRLGGVLEESLADLSQHVLDYRTVDS